MDPTIWLLVLVLFALAAALAAIEPRRLLPGLVLVPGLMLVGLLLAWALLAELIPGWGRDPGRWLVVGALGAVIALVTLLGLFLVLNAWTVAVREGTGPTALASGGVGVLLLAYVGFGVHAVTTGATMRVVWLVLLGLPAGYMAWVFVSFLLYGTLYGWAMRIFGRRVDAVIVLGSGLDDDDRVPPLLAARLDLGRRIYERSRRAGRSTILVPSGGRGEDEGVSEAEAMGRYLRERGVPEDHIRLEDRSTDTQENLEFSRKVLTAADIHGRVAVTTNNYHAFRASMQMRRAGIPGYALGARTARNYWPSAIVREFLAVVRDHLPLHAISCILLLAPVVVFAVSRS